MKKHSIDLSGHATSILIEDEFWNELKSIAIQKKKSLRQILMAIDNNRTTNLASAIRLYVLSHYIQISQNSDSQ